MVRSFGVLVNAKCAGKRALVRGAKVAFRSAKECFAGTFAERKATLSRVNGVRAASGRVGSRGGASRFRLQFNSLEPAFPARRTTAASLGVGQARKPDLHRIDGTSRQHSSGCDDKCMCITDRSIAESNVTSL
jgi:hypothetical protein